MFWNSTTLMTAADVFIVMITLFVWMIFFKQREMLFHLKLHFGSGLILLGLTTFALLYLADLAVMHLSPFFVPMDRGMEVMMSLHLNYSWPVTLIGTGLLAAGLYNLVKVLFPKILSIIEEAEHAKEEAEQASRAKSKFLASMSHELRTPMNAIIGFGEMISYNEIDPIDGKNREHLEYILTSAHHLLGLITQVLELAKIESGSIEIKPEVLSIQDVMPEIIQLIEAVASKNNITIQQVSCCGKSNATHVYADPLHFRQVMFNLLSNAVKYNKPDGNVEISCMVDDEDTTRIEIRDTGIGIPESKHEAVFQPFNRLGLEACNIEGSGIGLTITRDLVERMDGRVDFTSEDGVGSTFWVEFPLAVNAETK